MAGPADPSAARLAAYAAWLPQCLDAIVRASGPHVWRGPAADRFDRELEDQRRRLRAVADDLTMAARAQAVRTESVRIESVRIESVRLHDATRPLPGARIV